MTYHGGGGGVEVMFYELDRLPPPTDSQHSAVILNSTRVTAQQ